MPKVMQEKFEVRPPDPDVDGEGAGWATDKSARTKKGTPGREGRSGGDPTSRYSDLTANYNSLPPGMDTEDQEMTDQRIPNESIAGNFPRGHNAGDRTQDLNAKSLRRGYDRKPMLSTDDEYYHQHNDPFYVTVETEDGEESFCERGNLLDRL